MTIAARPTATKAAVRQSGRVQASAASVFLEPDKDAKSLLGAEVLDDPEALATYIAQDAEDALAAKIFGGEKTANNGVGWFSQLSHENLEVENLGTREEGAEYQLVQIKPGDLERIDTDDIGGKFRVTDEAIQNGALNVLADGIQLISRALRNRLDDMVLAALDQAATITSNGLFAVPAWTDVQLSGATPTPSAETPLASLTKASVLLRRKGLAAHADTLVVSPEDESNLRIAYGADYDPMLAGLGLTPIISDRMDTGSAYLLSSSGLGGVVSRNGLVVEQWRDPSIRSTWVQAFLEPAVFVSRPANVVKLTGIDTP